MERHWIITAPPGVHSAGPTVVRDNLSVASHLIEQGWAVDGPYVHVKHLTAIRGFLSPIIGLLRLRAVYPPLTDQDREWLQRQAEQGKAVVTKMQEGSPHAEPENSPALALARDQSKP